jgi:hypothetical protein
MRQLWHPTGSHRGPSPYAGLRITGIRWQPLTVTAATVGVIGSSFNG